MGRVLEIFQLKKKKSLSNILQLFFLSFFFPLSLLQTSSLSQLSPRWKIYCFAACPIARHYLSFSIPRPRLTSLLPPLYDRPVRIESDVLIDVLPSSEDRRKARKKFENLPENKRTGSTTMRSLNRNKLSIPRIANYRQLTVYKPRVERGTSLEIKKKRKRERDWRRVGGEGSPARAQRVVSTSVAL